MAFIAANWYYIVLALVFLCGGTISVIRFTSKSKEERYKQIRGWLLQAVLIAEKTFGSGTGKLKLSSVYDKFVEKFQWLAKVIPFTTFSEYVDDALDEMKDILEKNNAIAAIVNQKEEAKTS